MKIALTIIIMMGIGALIGGFTNSLAIKMLFRPYKAIYIGKWKMPFTPGLIPKRREELAEQLGRMVVDHLLTPESVQKKFLNESFQLEMTKLVQSELERFFSKDQTPLELLEKFGVVDGQAKLEVKVDDMLEDKYIYLMEKYKNEPVKELMTPELLEKVESKIPLISSYILQKGTDYFDSTEGELRIQRMVDDFVKERSGMLGNMLQMFLGNVNLTDKIRPEIIKFLKSEGTHDLVTTLLHKEWNKVLLWEASKLEAQVGRQSILVMIKDYSKRILKLDKGLNTPISQISLPIRETVVEKISPNAVMLLGSWLGERVHVLMERLHLADIVREQVESFSVERLEEMVLSITKSELKMITYLGALLGGMIGLAQGILVLFL
ncbi:DUF445 family protein [Cytobacillus spongiae]|jgi:uncharacterized membrane protein YheB (UPF0754 family)|uniref:DUF445 domain-containing protein n=1 Tax=Cytobacillus spongiae TaxID=2901381 RepID=UPI001F1AA2D7|nr:DUF445 family protein [Cytobacillus spongiae]UII56857.1 DUF445 family protein [Cytobacillus spongiae]